MSSQPSEYGGLPGIIQPEEAPEGSLYGHPSRDTTAVDRRGVREAAMILRRAGLKDARGVPAETIIGEDGVASFIAYDEDRARRDYIEGNND